MHMVDILTSAVLLVPTAIAAGVVWLRKRWAFLSQWVEYARRFESVQTMAEATFDRSPVPMAVVEDGHPIHVNQRLIDFLQRSAEDLKQMKLKEITHPEDHHLDEELCGQLRSGSLADRTYQVQKRYIRPGGDVVWALLHVALLRGEDGPTIAVVQDVDQQVKLTQQLQNRIQDLEDYGSALSHEIKEPVRTLGMRLEMFRSGIHENLDHQSKRNLEYVVDAVGRLRRLVKDLLEYGGSLSDVYAIPGQVDVAVEWCLHVIEGLEERHIVRNYQPGTQLPLSDQGLERILQNLLSNSWKFRHYDREPEIIIGVEESQTDYTLYVEDNGQGMDPEYRHSAFDMFSRGNLAQEGTGVGLAICRRIIDSVYGSIHVEDTSSGEGIRIVCTIPRTGE